MDFTNHLGASFDPTVAAEVFKDAMATAAAIDRLVHHSVILELNVRSYRLEKARQTRKEAPPQA